MASVGISGLASGIDTASLIDQLMAVEQQPLLVMEKKKSNFHTEVNAWSDIKTRLTNLSSRVNDLQEKLNFYAKSTSSSNDSIVTASASTDAMAGTYNINITSIATSTKVESSGRMGSFIDPTALLKDAGLGTAITAGTFSINGVAISIDPEVTETDTLNKILDKINTSVPDFEASYDGGTGKITFSSTSIPPTDIKLGSGADTSNFFEAIWVSGKTGSAIESSVPLGTVQVNKTLGEALFQTPLTTPVGTTSGSFEINGVEIAYDTSVTSISDIIKKINNSEAKVTATYDAVGDKIQLQAKDTGSLNISLKDVSGNFLTATGLLGAAQDLGDNAVYSIDEVNGGQQLTSTKNSIEGVIPGVNFTLKNTGNTEITINNDIDATVSKIDSFVSQYNSTMSLIKGKLDKEAVLQGDASLMRLQSSLRNKVTGVVSGVTSEIDLASEIGLEIDKEGTLSLDQTKLKEVLADNPDKVFDLFNAEDGIATKLDEEIEMWTKSTNGIIPTKEDSIKKQIEYTEKSIEKFEERLEAKRKLLESQFLAMEKAMSSLTSQGDWLAAQVSSLPSWSKSE